jgi:hypothetical protein
MAVENFEQILCGINNSEIRIALERLFALCGVTTGNSGSGIVKDVIGDVTGDLTGDVTGNVTGDVTGDVIGDIVGALTGSNSAGVVNMLIQNAQLGSGGMGFYQKTQSADITADTSVDIDVDIPAGAVILGAQIRVDTALVGGETWDAAYKTGATQAIASNAAVAKNTKVNTAFDANGATAITSDVTKIAISPNGGGSFTATGSIRAVVYYMTFEALDDQA